MMNMSCKIGYVHSYSWFPLQGKRLCINCLEEFDSENLNDIESVNN